MNMGHRLTARLAAAGNITHCETNAIRSSMGGGGEQRRRRRGQIAENVERNSKPRESRDCDT